MDLPNAYFSRLLPTLAERSRNATLSRLGFAHAPLYRHLSALFSRPYGEVGSLLAAPSLEAVFGWAPDQRTLGDLAGSLLAEPLVKALDEPPDLEGERCPERTAEARRRNHPYRFGRERHPYRHQVESWVALAAEPPESLVVASGTGSGKTECFMVPILDRLVRQQALQGGRLVGVRALFLYPLNALINSQRERLRAWTHAFGRDIRFCLYNGNTPERLPAAQANRHPNEVQDRRTLRDAPPPILVTNATMLEYMLVRAQDAPILDQSQGLLEWVVLDEAHTYMGSQAAELALLIRRVLHAFGVRPEQVRFVATSATIGDPQGEAGRHLRRFLGDVAGVGEDRVRLVAGGRLVPDLGAEPPPRTAVLHLEGLEDIEPEVAADAPAPNRFTALVAHPLARAIRRRFIDSDATHREQGGSGMVATLTQVCRLIHGDAETYSQGQQAEALRWLDLLSGTRSPDGTPFLPLRGHLFHQSVSGLWACADGACPERTGTDLDDPTWPFGAVYLEPRQHCRCGAPVYELVACDDCGTPFLLAVEQGGCLRPPRGRSAIDEFELDAEPVDGGAEDSEDAETGTEDSETRVLVVNRPDLPNTGTEVIDRATRRFAQSPSHGSPLTLVLQHEDGGLTCPCCGGKEREGDELRDRKRKLMQEARIGAPFALGTILPTLLEFAPDERCRPAELPYRGRRLLTFNDSRQGTARMAARLQQESERNRVRGLVYHLALREGRAKASGQADKLVADIELDESLLSQIPSSEGRRKVEVRIKQNREQLAALTQPTPIPFNRMAELLADQGQDFGWMLDHYRDDVSLDCFANAAGPLTLARMFLVREFGRRPKRMNNLETMGLVAVSYPGLDLVRTAPDGFGLSDWRDFLKLALDFFVRAGGSLALDKCTRQWLGMRFRRKDLVERDRLQIAEKEERRWPRARRSGLRNHLVRLLAYTFRADIATDYGEDLVDSVLGAAWKALTEEAGILKSSAGGRRTLPLEHLAFAPVTSAWVCPVTLRFLDTTLRGMTPYLPRQATEATARCRQVEIPLYDQPFGGDLDPLAHIGRARNWLRQQATLGPLRAQGLWQSLNDRVIELAPYYVAAEHSAQQPSDRLDRYEKAFKRGDLNLLSCSTTMEMGIDIGGIAMVAMNNVPPHPANYLQRAGRAGRRQEARSLAMTLCKSNPHDQVVFNRTDWPFATPLPAPRVALNSSVIVQRHVNALVLTRFLRATAGGVGQDASRLTCGWFFLPPEGQSPAQRLVDQYRGATALPPVLAEGLGDLVRGTLFEGVEPLRLARGVADALAEAIGAWLPEWEVLSRQAQDFQGDSNDPAHKAVRYQIERMEGEYLLRELADLGFLPAYGFPTHVAAFDNITAVRARQLRLQREQDGPKGSREDNRMRRRELANRDAVTALREYAPGAEVVMDGLVYRSAGITLNWKVPATEAAAREVQAIHYAWRCRQCGASGSSRVLDEARQCSECGAEVRFDADLAASDERTFIEPAGFAVDFYTDPHNDVSTQQFIPVEPAWVSGRGPWLPLPNPELGRFRVSTRGHLFHQSNGLSGQGYAICLVCGRAAPMGTGDHPLPEVFTKPHRKLRGDRGEGRQPCPGSDQPWAIKPRVTLGHETFADVFEVQLRNLAGAWLGERLAALTLGVALRDALAGLLGVSTDELGCDAKPARPEGGGQTWSILVYDRFAAGYASSADGHLGRLFHRARGHLDCRAGCDSACPQCVLDFDQRFLADHLNRHEALKLLTPEWLDALRLPEALAFFGPESRPEYAELGVALLREARHGETRAVRLFGSGADGDLGPSPLRHLAYRLAGAERPVELVLDTAGLDALEPEDRHLLASLADHPGVRVCRVQSLPRAGAGWVVAEVEGAGGTRRWAVPDPEGLRADGTWGALRPLIGSGLTPGVRTETLEPLTAAALRPAPLAEGGREIEVQHELDGPIQGFGGRFWDLVAARHSGVAALLGEGGPDLATLAYQDRYLLSPLPLALLVTLVDALRARVGLGRWAIERLRVETCNERPAGAPRPGARVWSDWPETGTRDAALAQALDYIGIDGDIASLPRQATQHGRRLLVGFADGRWLRIHLDQGLSYWRYATAGQGPGGTGRFDFRADPTDQGATIATLCGQVEGAAQPTQIFLGLGAGTGLDTM